MVISKIFNNFDKAYYTSGAYENYLQRFQKEGEDYALRIVKALSSSSSWKFLDVGCGMGGIILGLRKLGFEAWGTEISPYCLKNSPAKKWIKSFPLTHLPFESHSFEVVICVDVFYYLTKKELKKVIKKLTRIAKNYLYIETICQDSPNAKQKYNPDPLRKQESVLEQKELKKLFADNKAFFLKPLFKKGEKINLGPLLKPIKKIDFNGFLIQESFADKLSKEQLSI